MLRLICLNHGNEHIQTVCLRAVSCSIEQDLDLSEGGFVVGFGLDWSDS